MIKDVYEFKLPDVGEGIHEAEISRWLVTVGDTVILNQPLLEIQTDKAIVEIPAPVGGIITEIKAKQGGVAYVGDTLVLISQKTAISHPTTTESGAQNPIQPATAPTTGIAEPGKRVLAAPAVRKLALELGVDLARVSGSGPAGRVLPGDVRQHASHQQTSDIQLPVPSTVSTLLQDTGEEDPINGINRAFSAAEEEPLLGIQRQMAHRMDMAWRTIPHATILEEINATNLVALRKELKPEAERRGTNLTYLPFVIKATVQVLKEFPYFNASINMEAQKIIKHQHYHIGVATDTPAGLLVPVLRHADRNTLIQLAANLKDMAERARQRRLTSEELTGSTFSITNFGSFGTSQAIPIINPPEVAILGCGAITDKAVPALGQVTIQPVLPLTLSFDHRLIDGAAAAQFMNRLKVLLTTPSLLLLEMA
jgi:pyruvate dehydrogenase E2 component (dihydrolipoamide acetyltransferase)